MACREGDHGTLQITTRKLYSCLYKAGLLVQKVKQALWNGGIERSNVHSSKLNTPGINQWSDLVLLKSNFPL